MFIKPVTSLFKNRPDAPYMSYLGTVEDNEDPDKLGRIKVRIEPYTDYSTEDLPWASPTLGASGNSASNCGFHIPEKGSQVRVYFPSKDLTAPYYMGAELNEVNRSTFLDDDYPNSYGFRDSKGNFVRVNKAQEKIHMQHSSGTNFKVTDQGDVQLELSKGPVFNMFNARDFLFSLDSEEDNSALEISGTGDGNLNVDILGNLEVNANRLLVNAPFNEFTGDVKFDTGASGIIWGFGWVAFVKDGLITSIRPFGS